MKLINKKTILMFFLFFVIFSVAAIVVAALLSIGRGGLSTFDKAKSVEGDSFNILLVLTDYAPELFDDYDGHSVENVFGDVSDETGERIVHTEAMLLARFDSARGELTLTSIPGNTVVSIRGKEITLDCVASEYGSDTLVEKIRAMTGLEVDSRVFFTPESAGKVFGMLGEIKHRIPNELSWKDADKGIDINIKAGRQTFDGKNTVDLVRYYSFPSMYHQKDEILLDFTKKIIKNLIDDFTYDELCGIMSSISETAFVKGELNGEQIKLLRNSDKLHIKLLTIKGELDSGLRFIPDEEATLEEFKPYRRIYADN